MSRPSRHIIRSILPLVLIFSIVLAGFSLIIVRQNDLHSFEQKIDAQIHNAMAKKELGDLIVGDLRKVATHFYMILISADEDRQELLLTDAKLTILEIHAALDLLSAGGTLPNRSFLKLPGQDTSHLTISYTPKENKSCRSEVAILRPELATLEEQLEKTISATTIRNRLLKNPVEDSLQDVGLQLRHYAKGIHSQFEIMTKHASKISYAANHELLSLKSEFVVAQDRNQQVELLWIIVTILCVFGFIGVVFRQIIATQGRLEETIQQLQQTEHDLQSSHAEVVVLNQSLEEQIAVRTKELAASEKLWAEAFDAVTSPIFLHNQKGRILKANQAYLDLAECTFEHAFGHFYWEVFPKQDSALPGCLESFSGGGEECQIIEQDVLVDDKIFRSQSFAIYSDQGVYLYSMHYMEDVTEKRKVSEALQQSEKRFREVTNSLNDVLILIDTDLKVQMLNDAAIAAYGITDKNYFGKSCHEIFWGCGEVCENCPTLDAMRTGKTFKAMRYMEDGTILD
ncbi:MAG: PAS domain-containing protein, partial [Desulfuromusa sp.]|nr:PAS domain-containing protein [Desulfuromusa sp.]